MLIIVIPIFATLQNYNISWTCSGCRHQRSGSKVSLQDTTTTFSNLERDQTFRFSVYANTNFGQGEISTITATISRYFGQVQYLRQSVKNYTLTLDWDRPSDVEAKDIKVSCAIVFLGEESLCLIVFVLRICLFLLMIVIHRIFVQSREQGKDLFSYFSFNPDNVSLFTLKENFARIRWLDLCKNNCWKKYSFF